MIALPLLQLVASGFGFVEGPAFDPREQCLLFSDIRNDRVLRLGDDDRVTTFLEPSGRANGLAFDRDGNLWACLGGARQVVRIAPDGTRTVVASEFGGKRLNSPNDLALDGDGGVWFTDPRYGDARDVEQDVMGVYHVDRDGTLRRAIATLERPNGILQARDGSGLYVAEPNRRELWWFPILGPGRVGTGRVLFTGDAELDRSGPDGMCLDEHGNVYATYAGIVVLAPNGRLLRRIPVPEHPANCILGGPDGKTLYVTARTGLYRFALDVRGAPLPPAERAAPAPIELPEFAAKTVDPAISIGYGVAIADVDGDRRLDLVLCAGDVIAWYENPSWQKHVIARRLTRHDHVCVAARDTDGDGRAELAVGAGWNPGDTEHSGSVHWLEPAADPRAPWTPRALPHEPTVHRMHFVAAADGTFDLVVAPLHGRGNVNAEGAGVRILAYRRDSAGWQTAVVDDALHATHNLAPVQWDNDPEDELLVAAREGVFVLDRAGDAWQRTALYDADEGDAEFRGASEVRAGRLADGRLFVATIEPFHGHEVVVYVPPEAGGPRRTWLRRVVDGSLRLGHALACGDLLGLGHDQILAGWREPDTGGQVGIRLYVPLDPDGRAWQAQTIASGIACEDLRLADLDGDDVLEVVAAGRASHDLRILRRR